MTLFIFNFRTTAKVGIILMFTTYLIAVQPFRLSAQDHSESVLDDLKYFLSILEQDSCPTISMAEQFCHQACAEEDDVIINHYYDTLGRMTDKEGWSIGSYFNNIYSDEYCTTSPSFYLLWLRKKLPISPKLTIVKIKEEYENGPWANQTVFVQLDQVSVVFDRNIYETGRKAFYRITPVIIDGHSVNELLVNDVNNGIMDPCLPSFGQATR